VEADGNGEIALHLEGADKPAGYARVLLGEVIASAFSGPPRAHELRLRFSDVDDLVPHGVTTS
jgi:hypothetical protein